MSDLFWLTDEQIERLRPFFPRSRGKPRVDDRRVLSGIVFVNRNGLRWRDAPSEYGPHKTLYNRWKRWGDPCAFRAALIAGADGKARRWAAGWPCAGYRMTIFSASEEKVVEEHILHARMYFDMPRPLPAADGTVETTTVDFEPNVVVDRELITGQNPRSDHPIAKALVDALGARHA